MTSSPAGKKRVADQRTEETDTGHGDDSDLRSGGMTLKGFGRVRSQLMKEPTEQDAQGEKQKEIEMLDRLGIMRGRCEPSLLRLRLAAHRAV
jgi:hypothetical protein